MVTASIPIVIQDGPRKKGIRAIAGIQMKYENFAEIFLDSFSSCVAYPCTQPLTCRNDVSDHHYDKTPMQSTAIFIAV